MGTFNLLPSEYEQLIEITRELAGTLDLDRLLKQIVNVAADLCACDAASILLYDDAQEQLYFQTASNLDDNVLHSIQVPLEGSIAGWVIKNLKPAIVIDAQHDPRHYGSIEKQSGVHVKNLIAFPLINNQKIIGVIEVLNKQNADPNEQDLDRLSILASQAAIAIETIHLFQQTDYMAGLVHDLRTPLSSIRVAAHLLQRTDLQEEQRNSLAQTIQQEVQRLDDLANVSLDLSRLESGRFRLELSEFDYLSLIQECINLMGPFAVQENITILYKPPENELIIRADREKIKRVLMNLLSNAIKFNRPEGEIIIQVFPNQNHLKTSIQDTGYGITELEIPMLFQKFQRLSTPLRTATGSGLGLYICKKIIDWHRGTIKVESTPGKSTTFTFELPIG